MMKHDPKFVYLHLIHVLFLRVYVHAAVHFVDVLV